MCGVPIQYCFTVPCFVCVARRACVLYKYMEPVTWMVGMLYAICTYIQNGDIGRVTCGALKVGTYYSICSNRQIGWLNDRQCNVYTVQCAYRAHISSCYIYAQESLRNKLI